MRKAIFALLALCFIVQLVTSGSATAAVPDGGAIKIICPYGVGGTADAVVRKYALVAGKLYPEYNFIVENMTGGDGFAGADYYANLKPTTTELILYGYGVAYRHDMGKKYQTEVVDFDRKAFYPLSVINDRTWILYAKPGITLEQILEKAKTDSIKMSGGNPLSDPHLTFGSLIALGGGKRVMVVPYDGGALQKKGLTDGEVDVFIGTPEAGKAESEAGTIVPLLAFSDKAFEGFVTPSGQITLPAIHGDAKAPALNPNTDYRVSIIPASSCIATRAGADQAWIDKMIEISKAVWASEEYSGWIAEIMLNKVALYGDDANTSIDEACKKALAAFEILK